jgi:erythromycin esterase-like protein
MDWRSWAGADGEASHGTHDFCRERALITRRLIEEKGFNAVAIEGDWPHAARMHRFVRSRSKDISAPEALGDFARFRAWMWRNMDGLAFVDWLLPVQSDACTAATGGILRP